MLEQKRRPLIRVISQGSDFNKPEGGGGKRKVFTEVTTKLRNQLSRQVEASATHFEDYFRLNPQLSGVLKVKLRKDALAKSHRPTYLFQKAKCQIVGVGEIGELFVSVNKAEAASLKSTIMSDDTKTGEACLSTIEKIEPYTANDAISFERTEDLFEEIRLKKGVVKLKLFNHADQTKNAVLTKQFRRLLADLQLTEFKTVEYSDDLQLWQIRLDSEKKAIRLASFIGVRSISTFPTYRPLYSQSIATGTPTDETFPPPSDDTEYPTLGVVDSGINPADERLKKWVLKKHNFIPKSLPHDFGHGSFVAGLAINSKSLNHNDDRFHSDSVKIVDVAILTNEGVSEDELKAALDEVIPENPSVKVWNLSLSSDDPCNANSFSDLAVALDQMQDKYGVVFVVAAGNYKKDPLRTWPPQDLNGEDVISFPADSVRAVTVGSLAHVDRANSVVKSNSPSPFSRRGPGPVFVPKPELVHFGGNCAKDLSCNQTGILSLNGRGQIAESVGTSFSTPIVSSSLANIYHQFPDISRSLAKALLIHSAATSSKKISSEHLRYYGFGVPKSFREIFDCPAHSVTSVFEFDLVPGLEFSRIIPIPKCMRTPDGKTTGTFTLTLVYDPPLDNRFGSEYCRSNVDVSLGTYTVGDDGKRHQHKQVPLSPDDIGKLYESVQIEHGFKWSPVKVYKRSMPNGVMGDEWRLLISMFHRSQYTSENPQRLSVVLTLEDPEGKKPVYDEFNALINKAGWKTSVLGIEERARVRRRA